MMEVEPIEPDDTLVCRIASMLRQLAAKTGDERFRWAAAALRQRRPGRRAIDDTAHVEEMAALLASGRVATVARAAALVARTLQGCSGSHSEEATADRLRRKYRQAHLTLDETHKSRDGAAPGA